MNTANSLGHVSWHHCSSSSRSPSSRYFLNYLDRNGLPQARLNTLEEDLSLEGYQYNTAISILFVGYILMQVPSNMFLTKTKPRLYLSICMMIWAVISACTALAHNAAGLIAARFFLGESYLDSSFGSC